MNREAQESNGEVSKKGDIESRVAEFWEAYKNLQHPSPDPNRTIGVSETFELATKHPEILDFYVRTSDEIDNTPEKLERLNYLWQKFVLPQEKSQEMTEEERKKLETIYRNYLEKKYGN